MTPRVLLVEADGGSRGNPGTAGYGALVREPTSGRILAERAEPLGIASNNVAEYRGLIAGLEAARDLDPSARIEVRMDSKLVVEQMSGRWRIKHPDMADLARQARAVVADIVAAAGSVRYEWIPREANQAADRLSNDAMDGKTIRRDLAHEAPEEPSALDGASPTRAPSTPSSPSPRAASGPGPRILLVRHGVTSFTEEGRLDGRGGADPALSALGREQARNAGQLAAQFLPAGRSQVVTSSLLRARQTGAAVADALQAPTRVDPHFDEQAFGVWDGALIADLIAQPQAGFRTMRDDPDFAPQDGESRRELASRVVPAWMDLAAAGGQVALVCHRIVIHVLLQHLLDLSDSGAWRLDVGPGSVTAVDVVRGEPYVRFVNRT